jgi:hypothetical protein
MKRLVFTVDTRARFGDGIFRQFSKPLRRIPPALDGLFEYQKIINQYSITPIFLYNND